MFQLRVSRRDDLTAERSCSPGPEQPRREADGVIHLRDILEGNLKGVSDLLRLWEREWKVRLNFPFVSV